MKKQLEYLFTSDYEHYRGDILAFFERQYSQERMAVSDAFYRNNPLGSPWLAICYDGDKIVGTENYIAHQLAFEGRLYRAHLGADTLVDPDYRLFHGVFGKLAQLTIEKLPEHSDLLYAIPNENSKKYYLKYFDWKLPVAMATFKKITYPSGLNLKSGLAFWRSGKLFNDVTLEQVSRFDEPELQPVIDANLAKTEGAYFYKSVAFLNWKYLGDIPYDTIAYLIRHKGQACGYLITYDVDHQRKVLDFLVAENNPDILRKALLSLAKLTTRDRIHQLSICATPDAWYRSVLQKTAFYERWDEDFTTYAYNLNIPDKAWIVHPGDIDAF